jgi:hypothetical protein
MSDIRSGRSRESRRAISEGWERTFGGKKAAKRKAEQLALAFNCSVCGATMVRCECCEAGRAERYYHCPKCQPELL